MWDYDSIEIRAQLYKLFFKYQANPKPNGAEGDWVDMIAHPEKKDEKRKEEGAPDANANEEGQAHASHTDAELDKQERKKRQ